VGANTRLDSLHDLMRHKANLRVDCGTCSKVSVLDASRFARYCLLRGWNTQLETLYSRLTCGRCGARPARLRAVPARAGKDPFPNGEREWKRLYQRLRD
jgi:ribosomal protein S27AE